MKNYVNIKGQIEETLSAKFMSLKNLKSIFRYVSERIFLIFCLQICHPFIVISTIIFMLSNTCSSNFTYFLSDLSCQCSYRKDQKLPFLVDLEEIDAS
jgi:hypothetical protein